MSGFRWTEREVRRALGIDEAGAGERLFARVSTDTRELAEGDLFVALSGDRFDGHDFLVQAAAAGATGAVVSRADGLPGSMVSFVVDDTLHALGELAAHRRRALPGTVVGLTGSSGKTTTKELLKAAVATTKRTHATAANLNNRIGVPRTLLSAPDDAEVVIVEMGTSEPGEIRRLAEIVRPELALLITVGESHLDELGSLAGVMEEKLDILRGRAEGGASLVGDLPPELPARARLIDPGVGVVGESALADPALRPSDVRMDDEGRVSFVWNGVPVALRTPGLHVARDAWLALAAAEWLGVETADAARGIAAAHGEKMRGEVRTAGPVRLVVDCYNANPQSTIAALDTLASRRTEDLRVALLGSMLELGGRRDALHEEVLKVARAHLAVGRLDAVFASGDYAKVAGAASGGLVVTADPAEAVSALIERIGGAEATVLLKASRGVRLERFLPELEAAFGVGAAGHPGGEG